MIFATVLLIPVFLEELRPALKPADETLVETE